MRYRVAAGIVAVAALVLATPLAASAAPVKPVVSFTLDVRSPEVGDTVTVTGVATHVPLSTTVTVQRHTRSGWRRVQVAFAGGKGEFVATFTASGLGLEPLRAVVAATKGHAAAASATHAITVYDWFPLDDVDPTASRGDVQTGPGDVHGVPHTHLMVFAPSAKSPHPSLTYEIDRVCTAVRANVLWAGETTGEDTLRVLADSVVRDTTTVTSTAGAGVFGSVRHARFVTLETDGAATGADQRAAWIDPDALCTADPANL